MGTFAVHRVTAGLAIGGACIALSARTATYGLRTPLVVSALFGAVLAVGMTLPDGSRDRRIHPAVALVAGCAAVLVVRSSIGIAPGVPWAANAFALTMVASIAEEALFRRALFGYLARSAPWLVIAISSLTFALTHVPLYGTAAFPAVLGAGVMLSWQRWASGRWEVPAATHAFANVLVYL